MGSPYIGEIRMFAGNFAPAGWAFCSGQLMPIAENDALFNLIGTTYGGDGQETFGLPNLQSRVPMHQGNNGSGITHPIAETGGAESVTLTTNQIPIHTHPPLGTGGGQQISPNNGFPAVASGTGLDVVGVYGPNDGGVPPGNVVAMKSGLIGVSGGSQPHDNMIPFLVINFIISLFGIFPTPS
jgi:microcystin-dependent protein